MKYTLKEHASVVFHSPAILPFEGRLSRVILK